MFLKGFNQTGFWSLHCVTVTKLSYIIRTPRVKLILCCYYCCNSSFRHLEIVDLNWLWEFQYSRAKILTITPNKQLVFLRQSCTVGAYSNFNDFCITQLFYEHRRISTFIIQASCALLTSIVRTTWINVTFICQDYTEVIAKLDIAYRFLNGADKTGKSHVMQVAKAELAFWIIPAAKSITSNVNIACVVWSCRNSCDVWQRIELTKMSYLLRRIQNVCLSIGTTLTVRVKTPCVNFPLMWCHKSMVASAGYRPYLREQELFNKNWFCTKCKRRTESLTKLAKLVAAHHVASMSVYKSSKAFKNLRVTRTVCWKPQLTCNMGNLSLHF